MQCGREICVREQGLHDAQVTRFCVEAAGQTAPEIVQPERRADTTLALPGGPAFVIFAIRFCVDMATEQVNHRLPVIGRRRHDSENGGQIVADRRLGDRAVLCACNDVSSPHICGPDSYRRTKPQCGFGGAKDDPTEGEVWRGAQHSKLVLRGLDLPGLRGFGDGNCAAEVWCTCFNERRKDTPDAVVSGAPSRLREVAVTLLDRADVTNAEVGEPDTSADGDEGFGRDMPRA